MADGPLEPLTGDELEVLRSGSGVQVRAAVEIDRLRELAAALADVDPVDDGVRCMWCEGATEEAGYADVRGPAIYADDRARQRLVRVPAEGVSHYAWWHERDCRWLAAWRRFADG